jgi:predicted MFS family arabinose efflux permease
MRNGG